MEDILAIVLILAGVASVILAVRFFMRRAEEKAAQEELERKQQIEATRKWREGLMKRMQTPVSSIPTPRKETPAPTYTRSTATQSSTPSDDGFVNGMLTGMLIDNVVHSLAHKSGGSSPIDFPSTEKSWGFDDSDSRKSISSSMDTSSSWSSSDSSSSDSGPSSDW